MILEKLVIPIGFDTGMLLEGIKAITGLITGAVDRTREWTEGMDALGDVTGMSEDKLAAWSFVAKKAGVEIETFSSATVIMAKGLLDSTGELSTTGKALQDFGIDVLDAGGKVRDQSDLMNDIGKKYAEFGTQTERVDFLTNIFGRSGAKLVDVFDTMAQEGGIDKVKEKVKSLGLVIDPTQYEDFQRNLSEVDLTFTGLANAFTGPLLPGAQSLLKTFTDWLQSPWVADAIGNIGEKLGTLASDIATGIQTGNWDAFFTDFKKFTGWDIEPLIKNLGKFTSWITDEALPKWTQFVEDVKTGWKEFGENTKIETSAIGRDWAEMLASLGSLMDEIFGTKGINLVVDWQAVGTTALQLVDLVILGMTYNFDLLKERIEGVKRLFSDLREGAEIWGDLFRTAIDKVRDGLETLRDWAREVLDLISQIREGGGGNVSGSVGGRTSERAAGGSASGMTWVGERGPELVNLPSGSYVNNNQASANMGFDYYKFASILAVELAKARD